MTLAVSFFSTKLISPLSSPLNRNHLKPLAPLHFRRVPFQFNGFSSKPCCCYSETSIPTFTSSFEEEEEEEDGESNSFLPSMSSNGGLAPPVLKKRKRYRKEYPGESKGITEEMRFVAMKLRNDKGSSKSFADSGPSDEENSDGGDESDGGWEPSMEGFLKYLVDSKVVFEIIEGVVEDSSDVSYAYFRRTGLERSECLARDLAWLSQQGMEIPEPGHPGVSYASYLKELAEKSAPLFLSHFYNVYFSHIAGGQVIAKQVAEKLLPERQLEFYDWEGDEQEFLKEVRGKLNRLSEVTHNFHTICFSPLFLRGQLDSLEEDCYADFAALVS